MAFTHIFRVTLWLAVLSTASTSSALANNTNNTNSNVTLCNNTLTPICFLEKTFDIIQPLKASDEKENILIEIGFESYFLNKKELFNTTMIELGKTNASLRESLPTALKKLSSIIKNRKNTPNILDDVLSNTVAKQLAQEEISLNAIKYKTMSSASLITSSLNNKPFNDSLQWNAAYIYYLTLTRDVSLKKSTEMKRFLIKQLAQSPPQLHQQKNLEIALLETLGGALKQGEETRLISNINGFSPHHLAQQNQRIIFYQQFTKFYNAKVGLNQDKCNYPLETTINSLNTFFSLENVQFIKQLDSLTINEPNDYLLASIILQHLDSCTPLSKLFQQRYLQSLSNIHVTKDLEVSSVEKIIRHLRSLRRYTKT